MVYKLSIFRWMVKQQSLVRHLRWWTKLAQLCVSHEIEMAEESNLTFYKGKLALQLVEDIGTSLTRLAGLQRHNHPLIQYMGLLSPVITVLMEFRYSWDVCHVLSLIFLLPVSC